MIRLKPLVTQTVTGVTASVTAHNGKSNAERQRQWRARRKAMKDRLSGLTWEQFVAETERAHG